MSTKRHVVAGVGYFAASHDSSFARIDQKTVTECDLARVCGVEVEDEFEVGAFERRTDAEDRVAAESGPRLPDGPEWSDALDALSEEDKDAWFAASHAKEDLRRRHDYRARTGREFPRVYRLALTIEATELSDDEAAEYWRKQRERHR